MKRTTLARRASEGFLISQTRRACSELAESQRGISGDCALLCDHGRTSGQVGFKTGCCATQFPHGVNPVVAASAGISPHFAFRLTLNLASLGFFLRG
jgi:hypothetical protein